MIFTIGHGTRTTEQLAALLREAGVALLVDVRRYPASRRHPHFARARLEVDLPPLGIAYDWRGEDMGGRRRPRVDSPNLAWRDEAFRAYADFMATADFQRALDRLLAEPRTLAVMCAETLWWRCHRRLIADALVARGVEVTHILGEGQTQRHALHEAARLENGVLIYDLIDVQQQLPLE